MKKYRNLQLESLLREELNTLFQKEFDFDGTFVTITNVAVDEKCEHAKVFLSIFPLEKEPGIYMMIQKHRNDLHFALLKRLKMRIVPALEFAITKREATNMAE
jgi:ribosome-binding factor A